MRRGTTLGLAGFALFLVCSAFAVMTGRWKLLGIVWFAFLAMAVAAYIGGQTPSEDPGVLVWGYGLASGAMITSAAVFLVPQSIGVAGQNPQYGGFGIALGLLIGFASHTVGHRLAHLDLPIDRAVTELTAHAASAGIVMGIIYHNMPSLGPLLGLTIVSHKGPAGYAAASRLRQQGKDVSVLLIPAVSVGIAAIAASLVDLPASGPVRGVVFGFASGIFLHVAMDFLPRCEIGSEIHEVLEVEGDAHAVLDRLRTHAVVSTSTGGLIVFVLWFVLTQ